MLNYPCDFKCADTCKLFSSTLQNGLYNIMLSHSYSIGIVLGDLPIALLLRLKRVIQDHTAFIPCYLFCVEGQRTEELESIQLLL